MTSSGTFIDVADVDAFETIRRNFCGRNSKQVCASVRRSLEDDRGEFGAWTPRDSHFTCGTPLIKYTGLSNFIIIPAVIIEAFVLSTSRSL